MNRKISFSALILFVTLLFNQTAFAQTDTTANTNTEIIIFQNGMIVFADVLELTPTTLVYTRNDLPRSPKYTIDRSTVYVVIYSNRTMETITPLGTPAPSASKSRRGSSYSIIRPDSAAFVDNASRGRLKVGVGSVRNHSSIEADLLKITENPAAPIFSYTFRYNRLFSIGYQLGIHNYSYQYATFNGYDDAYIELNFKEKLVSNAVFVRYDLLDLFVRPYIMAGGAFNSFSLESDSKIIFTDGQKGVTSSGTDRGSQLDFIGRVGADVSFSKRFGMYADIGTGINLIQTGVYFSFK